MHGWISGVLSIQGALIEIFSSSTTVVLVLVGVDDCPGLLQPLSGDFTSECALPKHIGGCAVCVGLFDLPSPV